MADEKSIVKINKMIHKKTGISFLVVYLIYVSLVYTDTKKTASCLGSVIFYREGGAPENWGIRYFFLDQKGGSKDFSN